MKHEKKELEEKMIRAFRDQWDNIKKFNIHIITVSEGETCEMGT